MSGLERFGAKQSERSYRGGVPAVQSRAANSQWRACCEVLAATTTARWATTRRLLGKNWERFADSGDRQRERAFDDQRQAVHRI